MLFGVAILCGLLLFLVLYRKWRLQYWSRRGVPQLKPNFVFGDFRDLLFGTESIPDFYLRMYKIAQAKGAKHLGLYNMWMNDYMPIDLGIIKNVLGKDYDYFSSHGFYSHKDDYLSENLFTLEGQAWKDRRVKMTPTFTSVKIKIMYNTLLEKTIPLLKVVGEAAEVNKPMDIKDVMARFATDIIASIAFGLDFNTLDEPEHQFRDIGREAFEPKASKYFLETLFNYNLLAKLGYRAVPKRVRTYFTEVLKQTINYREKNNVQRQDYMQLLLQMKNKSNPNPDDKLKAHGKSSFNDDDITNEAFFFYLAAFETSSSTMANAFTELSQQPEMQEKLRQEINETAKKHDGKLTYEALMEMDYLDKVMKETLRKNPVVPDLPRYCTNTYKVPGTDLVIEKGTRVHIPVIGIQRDPQYFPNPHEFNPENFSPENVAKRPDFAYMPFGEGPRLCLGMRFALMQIKLGVATLVKNFRLTLDESTQPPFEFAPSTPITRTKVDVLVKVTKI